MFLETSHTKLDVFSVTKELAKQCYHITRSLPADEKYEMSGQIRRAALSGFLNLAEGFSRHLIADRKRFFEIARGSLIEVDAALDIAVGLGYLKKESMKEVGELLLRSVQMLSKLIKN